MLNSRDASKTIQLWELLHIELEMPLVIHPNFLFSVPLKQCLSAFEQNILVIGQVLMDVQITQKQERVQTEGQYQTEKYSRVTVLIMQ